LIAFGWQTASREIVRLSDREDPPNSVQIVLLMIWKCLPTGPRFLTHFLLIASAAAVAFSALAAQTTNRYDSFRFGVCYYPEQWPESYWGEDALRMAECGVNTVRIGEFGWAIMEPREGHYDFSLFDRAIETLGRHGIKTIFGTPTATPPKWLTHKYPEV